MKEEVPYVESEDTEHSDEEDVPMSAQSSTGALDTGDHDPALLLGNSGTEMEEQHADIQQQFEEVVVHVDGASEQPRVRRPSAGLQHAAPHTIRLRDVSYYVQVPAEAPEAGGGGGPCSKLPCCGSKRAKKELCILKNVNLDFPPGSFTAMMGPSGAGKTTLLNILAQRTGTSHGRLAGTYLVDGKRPTKRFAHFSAYVMQEDVLNPYLTPRETLEYTAGLRLPKSLTAAERSEKVTALLDELGLLKCEHTVVGEPGVSKGMSGGEKKRLSIGIELLTEPSILWIDEPTSGLDSHIAAEVVQVLKDLTQRGVTIVTTIHQPNSEIFGLFDRLLLLSQGTVMYNGDAAQAPAYFEKMGYPLPEFTNPADFVLELVSTRTEAGQRRVDTLEAAWKEKEQELMIEMDRAELRRSELIASSPELRATFEATQKAIELDGTEKTASAWTKFLLLTSRNWKATKRNPGLTMQRGIQTIVMSLITGLIFLQIGDNDQTSIQDRNGALMFLLINNGFSAMMTIVATFALERPVFFREYSSGSYNVMSYYFARTITEIPFTVIFTAVGSCITYWLIGFKTEFTAFLIFFVTILPLAFAGGYMGFFVSVVTPNVQAALALAPIVMIPQILFAGFFLNDDSTPPYFIWLKYISPYKWGFEAAMRNEYNGLTFECPTSTNGTASSPCIRTGEEVLDQFSLSHSRGLSIVLIFTIAFSFSLLGLVILWRKAVNLRKANSAAMSSDNADSEDVKST